MNASSSSLYRWWCHILVFHTDIWHRMHVCGQNILESRGSLMHYLLIIRVECSWLNYVSPMLMKLWTWSPNILNISRAILVEWVGFIWMHPLEIISLMPFSFFSSRHSTLDACMWEEHPKYLEVLCCTILDSICWLSIFMLSKYMFIWMHHHEIITLMPNSRFLSWHSTL